MNAKERPGQGALPKVHNQNTTRVRRSWRDITAPLYEADAQLWTEERKAQRGQRSEFNPDLIVRYFDILEAVVEDGRTELFERVGHWPPAHVLRAREEWAI